MRYYPVCLDIRGRPCVVVGGGEVAARKVERLLESGAAVTVVARRVHPLLAELAAEGRIRHTAEDYTTGCLEGAFLVIGATDREEVNDRIAAACRDRGILVNIVDDPGRCDFILPALLTRGSLSIAVATDGKSPALARRLREELEGRFGPEYADYLDLLGRLRERIIAAGRPAGENRDVFTALVDSPLLEHLRSGRREEAAALIRNLTGLDIEADLLADRKVTLLPAPGAEATTAPQSGNRGNSETFEKRPNLVMPGLTRHPSDT
ncbi:MAG: bifunctional precorrin-2 dehydrogenase/sirohydrochlorin ferrochelatase [Pseudomonadota bacterium]|nr:bifunctional precorrin-2 dehydrogenase/sirohydrochlorin ferrochelatase [Pseudomonadota bacterium]